MSISTSTARLFNTGSQNRVLWIGIAASAIVHSAVLWLFPGTRLGVPEAPALPVITAILAPRAAAPPPVVETKPQVAPQPPPPVKPPPPQVKPAPEPPRPALTRPTPDASAPRVQQEPTPPAPPAQAAPPPPPPQVATAPPSTPPPSVRAPEPAPAPAAPAAPDPDAGNLAQYRLALIGAAKGFKRYPAQAMEKGWTGTVEVRVVVGPTGFPRSTSVKTSSGYQILDLQALDMVRRAHGRASVPPALRGREFIVDIPVIFDLKEG
jgi:protein TonB